MQTKLRFYSAQTLAPVKNLDEDVLNISYTGGLNGSFNGFVEVEETPGNKDFLQGLKENSHYMKIGLDKIFGAVVESTSNNESGVVINFIGAYDYFSKIDGGPSHRAVYTTVVADENDNSNIKIFYSDSTVGILYEVLRNLSESMSIRGFNSSLFQYGALRNHIITAPSSGKWDRSYRINGLETPTLKEVFDDIFNDSGMDLLRIRVSDNLSENFSFIFEVVSSANIYTISEASDDVFDVAEEAGQPIRRAFSIAKGTNLKDKSVVERVNFDNTVAYSSSIVSAPQERSGAIRRLAEGNALSEFSNEGVLNFSSFKDTYDVLDYIYLSSPAMGKTISGFITEKNLEGEVFTYRVQIGGLSNFNAALKKPLTQNRKIIFNPLSRVESLSLRTAQQKNSSTNWRS